MSDFASRLRVTRTTTQSKRQESRIARDMGGRVTPGSGNGAYQKGDVRTRSELVEAKTTGLDSYRLTELELRRHALHALKAGLTPVYQIDFEKNGGSSWVVLTREDYLALRRDT